MNISEITRRSITDYLTNKKVQYFGDMDELDFLSRLYDLEAMPSHDRRCKTASGDITTHRVSFNDWKDDWVFADERFNLLKGSDENFLRFLCEMLHPLVRRSPKEVNDLVKIFNKHLAVDGWELYAKDHISRRRIFGTRPIGLKLDLRGSRAMAAALDADYVHRQISRMEAAIDNEPDLAIGTAKEFVETVCKTILSERKIQLSGCTDIPTLTKETLKELKLVPEGVPEQSRGSEILRRVLSNLATITQGIAEIRGLYGTGHGRDAKTQPIKSRHAKLVVGAAVALATFLFETHKETKP